ncbi:YbaN family protein [Salibacterium aidingense]|uniref:YbaN family protein n=1 Tax=Salibacterium aidingense TaxID=384933 RepID=UPI000429051F|nr:YbaN family protein [Salibacterium aidingense]
MFRQTKKALFIIGGSTALMLGIIGIVLPLLPTTPFLLLAAWCYAKSSETLYDRLLASKWLGTYIKHFREERALPLKTKWTAVLVLWGSSLYSILFLVPLLVVQILLFCVVVSITYFIFSLNTLR